MSSGTCGDDALSVDDSLVALDLVKLERLVWRKPNREMHGVSPAVEPVEVDGGFKKRPTTEPRKGKNGGGVESGHGSSARMSRTSAVKTSGYSRCMKCPPGALLTS